MKLLMISGDRSLAAGKRGAFYNTLEEFHKYWDRVDIICPRIKNQKSRIKNIFGNTYIHPSPWPLWRQPEWILKKGKELHKEQNFDVMTVHEYPPFYNGIGARFLHNKIGVPYLLELHHIPGYPKTASIKERFYCWLTKVFIKYDIGKAEAIRVVNQKQVPEFLIKAGVPKEKIKYIPSMYIDSDIFRPMISTPGVTPGVEYDLVFAGRLEKNKNVGLLLEAVKIQETRYKKNIKLLIIGDGPEKENLKFKIKNLKLNGHVSFAGWLPSSEDVARAYNSAKIFVNPSLNEGGPRVALEAMACGLPVITTRVGIMNDIIKDGESGFFADWSPGDVAEKIRKVLESPQLQEKFSGAGIEIALKFERKKAIENYARELLNIVK